MSARETKETQTPRQITKINLDSDEEDEVYAAKSDITPRPSRKIVDPEKDNGDDLPKSDHRRARRRPPLASDDDEDDDLPVSSVRKQRTSRQPVPQDSDDDNIGVILTGKAITPAKRKPIDELEEDAELAANTPTLSRRTRGRPKETPYQKKLRHLKARREGREPTLSDDEEAPKKALYDTEDEDNDDNDEDNDEDDEVEEVAPKPHTPCNPFAPASPAFNPLDEYEDDDDFIVHDSPPPDLIGAPDYEGASEVPVMFTSASHLTPSTNFKLFARFLAMSILIPDIVSPKEPDDYVLNCVKRLEAMVSTYGDSILQSSIWKLDIVKAMKAYPEEDGFKLNDAEPHCDACNRDRTATYGIKFYGKRYDPLTLLDLPDENQPTAYESEPEDDDKDNDEEEGDENTKSMTVTETQSTDDFIVFDSDDDAPAPPASRRRKTRPSRSSRSLTPPTGIPAPNTPFVAGSFCYQRLKLSHAFAHWKRHLRDLVKNELIIRQWVRRDGSAGEKFREKVMAMAGTPVDREAGEEAGAERMGVRQKAAEEVVDALEGEWEGFWRQFKRALEEAEGMMKGGRKSGKGGKGWKFGGGLR